MKATELEADLSLAEGTDEPAAALPGGGQGRAHDEPVDSLAALINAMNERFAMELGDADRVLVDHYTRQTYHHFREASAS